MSAYADTSFLVSLYLLDANSSRAAARIRQSKPPIFLSPLGELEFVNAFRLRLFRKELTPEVLKAAEAVFANDIAQGVWQVTPLVPAAYETAKLIARQYTPRIGTRSIDVLHVASALVLKADTFYTFDRAQAKLARALGLLVP